MASSIKQLDPGEITPLHEPTHSIDSLADDMRENGWQGRPLLVVETPTAYLAWTGSHRIAAARASHLQAIPCRVIDEADLLAVADDPHWHCMDYERLAILRKTGDEAAIALMVDEARGCH